MLTQLGLYKLVGENPERAWPVARWFATPLVNVFAPSWGYGHDRVPEEGPGVVAANHFSAIDPAVLGIHSRRTLYYMAKTELLSVPIGGELLRWTGAFGVRRGEGDRDSVRVARWAVREGHMVGIFMEGTRQQLGYPGPMHPGAAMIAIQEAVPVIPVCSRHLRLEPQESPQVLRRLGGSPPARLPADGQGLQGGDGRPGGGGEAAVADCRAGDRRRISARARGRLAASALVRRP